MELSTRRRRLALGALAVAMLTIGLDVTVLTVALPTLAADLHANTSALQWFSTAYTLALAAVMLPAGALGDRFGRKKLLLGALIVFGVASLACAFATTPGQLVAGRVVLGLAAGVMMPLSMAVLPVLFPDPDERQRALTVWVTATAIGLPLGPIVGGWLLQHFWWGSAFLINVPMVAVGAVAVALLVPESSAAERFPIDIAGAVLSAAGMLGLTYGFIRLGEHGWDDLPAWAVVIAGVCALLAFAAWQRRAAVPLVDLGLFASARFRWGTGLSVLVNFAMFGLFFTVPQFFQAVLGTDAFGSGLRLLPLIGGLLVGSRAIEPLLPRVGARVAIPAGLVILGAGLLLGALTGVHSGYGYVAAWTTLLGIGMGVVMPTAMGMAMADLPAERAGSGSGLMQALRQAGGTIGVAMLGTVALTRYRDELGPLDRAPISDGVTAGVAVTRRLGDPAAVEVVQRAFVSGMSATLAVCAALCLLTALAAAIRLRSVPRTSARAAGAAESVHVG